MREFAEHFAIEAPQEFDRLEVLAAAMLVRNPAALGPAVVEIQHRRDGIDAQSVDTVAIEPEQRVGDQEVDDLGAPVVVDQRAPVLVAALQRIGVFIERRAVEVTEPVRVVGKMPRHPVEQHANTFAMTGIDEMGEIGR